MVMQDRNVSDVVTVPESEAGAGPFIWVLSGSKGHPQAFVIPSSSVKLE